MEIWPHFVGPATRRFIHSSTVYKSSEMTMDHGPGWNQQKKTSEMTMVKHKLCSSSWGYHCFDQLGWCPWIHSNNVKTTSPTMCQIHLKISTHKFQDRNNVYETSIKILSDRVFFLWVWIKMRYPNNWFIKNIHSNLCLNSRYCPSFWPNMKVS
jgi:hypothetical protein